MNPEIRLRPVTATDLEFLERFVREPGLIGPDWAGFRPVAGVRRRFEEDEFLGPDDGRLIVEADREAAGFVSWHSRVYAGVLGCWEIGIALLPEWRTKGLGWRAQDQLCAYLFEHTPAKRIEAGTQPENAAEQRSLLKAGFTREGVIRSAEFRGGRWRDGILFSRLRSDPPPD